MIDSLFTHSAYGFALVFTMMSILWIIYRMTDKPMIVDAGWGIGLALVGMLYAYISEGDMLRRFLLGAMTGLWGLRLGLYLLFTRVLGSHHDERYDTLKRNWKTHVPLKFFFFYQAQALFIVVLMAPMVLAANNTDPDLSIWEYTGVILWFISLIGETLADSELKNFKTDPSNKGKVCQTGLWYYSRHPNYFFEWMIWISFFVFTLGIPLGWISAYPPFIMLYLLLKVTGIPMTEEQSVKTKGEAYREYQRTTSMFIPWFKRK